MHKICWIVHTLRDVLEAGAWQTEWCHTVSEPVKQWHKVRRRRDGAVPDAGALLRPHDGAATCRRAVPAAQGLRCHALPADGATAGQRSACAHHMLASQGLGCMQTQRSQAYGCILASRAGRSAVRQHPSGN